MIWKWMGAPRGPGSGLPLAVWRVLGPGVIPGRNPCRGASGASRLQRSRLPADASGSHPVAQSEAVAIAATATPGCFQQPISEELYDAIYNLRRDTPALARMIVNKMLEDSTGVE